MKNCFKNAFNTANILEDFIMTEICFKMTVIGQLFFCSCSVFVMITLYGHPKYYSRNAAYCLDWLCVGRWWLLGSKSIFYEKDSRIKSQELATCLSTTTLLCGLLYNSRVWSFSTLWYLIHEFWGKQYHYFFVFVIFSYCYFWLVVNV